MQLRICTAHRFDAMAVVAAFLISLCTTVTEAQTDHSLDASRKQTQFLDIRADLQRQIEHAEQELHQVNLEREDKLEELEQLSRAHADLDRKRAFSKAIEDEIADQSSNLRRIERQRSDCLEELDTLYRGLSEIDHEIADCAKRLH